MTQEAPSSPHSIDWLGLPVIAAVARLLCRELTPQNEYLRVENKILKSRVEGRIRFSDEERRSLTDAALALGSKLMKEAVSIVKPETILAWQRRLQKQKWDYSDRCKQKLGRPRTQENAEKLVCNMARENTWGYRRIQGELQKLGIEISKSCVAAILRRNGLPPAPERRGLTWREFLARHADVLLCADLFTQEVRTFCGLRTAYIFFVIHLRTRTLLLVRATFSPHSQWLEQQARNALWECGDRNVQPRFLLHDNDACFCERFHKVLRKAAVGPLKSPFQAPNANAHAERWIRSIRGECLSHLIMFGLDRLQRVLDEYRMFFNGHRPHQGIGNQVPAEILDAATEADDVAAGEPCRSGDVQCEEFLGGLLKSYSGKAA